jgi:RNA polymerase sigma-70 factor, ECF subfamily
MFTHNALLAETGKLQKFALRLTKNKSDADDLLQSTCLRALEKGDIFQDGTNLFSWTSKIMFNLFASDYRRRMKFDTNHDMDTHTVQPMQEIGAEMSNIKRAMLKLSADHQDIIVMICVKGMSYKEVSMLFDIPIGTVRSRLSRARKELLVALEMPSQSSLPKIVYSKNSANSNVVTIPAFIAAQALKRAAHI